MNSKWSSRKNKRFFSSLSSHQVHKHLRQDNLRFALLECPIVQCMDDDKCLHVRMHQIQNHVSMVQLVLAPVKKNHASFVNFRVFFFTLNDMNMKSFPNYLESQFTNWIFSIMNAFEWIIINFFEYCHIPTTTDFTIFCINYSVIV